MRGRTALVTGASRGIGKAISSKFAELGANVLTPTRNELDLNVDASVDNYISSLDEPVDILVNNAGINPLVEGVKLTDEDLYETVKINLTSPTRLIRGIAPRMVDRQYGRIVNISSIWGSVSKPKRLAYTISKTGLNGMTRAFAVELSQHNVLVNAVAPGFVNTELTRKNLSESEIEQITKGIPLRRLAEPEEIAEVVAFLCSEKNTFTTGQVLLVDGGFSCQ